MPVTHNPAYITCLDTCETPEVGDIQEVISVSLMSTSSRSASLSIDNGKWANALDSGAKFCQTCNPSIYTLAMDTPAIYPSTCAEGSDNINTNMGSEKPHAASTRKRKKVDDDAVAAEMVESQQSIAGALICLAASNESRNKVSQLNINVQKCSVTIQFAMVFIFLTYITRFRFSYRLLQRVSVLFQWQ